MAATIILSRQVSGFMRDLCGPPRGRRWARVPHARALCDRDMFLIYTQPLHDGDLDGCEGHTWTGRSAFGPLLAGSTECDPVRLPVPTLGTLEGVTDKREPTDCIYPGPHGAMSAEHYLSEGLGTFAGCELLTGRVCRPCNTRIGDQTELQFLRSGQVGFFRWLLGIEGKDGFPRRSSAEARLKMFPDLTGKEREFDAIKRFIWDGGDVGRFVQQRWRPEDVITNLRRGAGWSHWMHILMVERTYQRIIGWFQPFAGPRTLAPLYAVDIGMDPARIVARREQGATSLSSSTRAASAVRSA
jgi:hypothetical protein